jgi:tetratricopeptide (TPR) repeat protein
MSDTTDATTTPETAPVSLAALRLAANEMFKQGHLETAAKAYERAASLRTAEDVVERTQAERDEEAVKCYGNLCTVYQRLGRVADAVRCAKAATEVQPAYAKGLAFRGQHELKVAAESLTNALVNVQRRAMQERPVASGDSSSSLSYSYEGTIDACDERLMEVMEAYRWIAAASLLSSTLAEQLQTSHTQFAQALMDYRAVTTALTQLVVSSPPADRDVPLVESKSGSKYVTAGTGIVAARRLPMHTIVASLERPLCVGYYSETIGQRLCVCCAAVEQPNAAKKFSACAKCNCVAYCSEACAAEYAERHVQHECNHMRNLRTMLKHIDEQQRDAPSDLGEVAMHAITALSAMRVSHPDAELLNVLDNHADEVTHTLGALVPLVGDLLAHENPRLVQRLCGVTRCNAIQLADSSGAGVGQAIFAGYASRFNHSCSPNAALDVEARLIRTIRPIRRGEEITISYTPQLYLPRELRRSVLSERYYFYCRCASCEGASQKGSTAATVEALLKGIFTGARSDAEQFYRPKYMALAEAVRNSTEEEVSEATLAELTEALAEAKKQFLPTHYLLQELRNATVFAASVLGRKAEVAALAEEEEWLWEVLVPGALPVKHDKLRNWLLATEELASTPTASPEGLRPEPDTGAALLPPGPKGTLRDFYTAPVQTQPSSPPDEREAERVATLND